MNLIKVTIFLRNDPNPIVIAEASPDGVEAYACQVAKMMEDGEQRYLIFRAPDGGIAAVISIPDVVTINCMKVGEQDA